MGVGVEPGGLRSSYWSDRGRHWAWTMGGQRDRDSRCRWEALWARIGVRGGGTSGGSEFWAFCVPPLIQGGRWSQGPRFAQSPLAQTALEERPSGIPESPSPEAWTLDCDSEQGKQVQLERTIGQTGKGFWGRRGSPWEGHILSDLKGRACLCRSCTLDSALGHPPQAVALQGVGLAQCLRHAHLLLTPLQTTAPDGHDAAI